MGRLPATNPGDEASLSSGAAAGTARCGQASIKPYYDNRTQEYPVDCSLEIASLEMNFHICRKRHVTELV